MKPVKLSCQFSEYDESELSSEDKRLLNQARSSLLKAYAPYSGFNVGAAVMMENGDTISGNNQENASYPLGLCAERVAIFSASANYSGIKIKAIAIAASSKEFQINKAVTPCGACRQVIAEYESKQKSPIRIIMAGENNKVLISDSIKELLPLQFTADNLKSK
jgi:cytidine deaminase